MSYNDIKKMDTYINIIVCIFTTLLCIMIFFSIDNSLISNQKNLIIRLLIVFWCSAILNSSLCNVKKSPVKGITVFFIGSIPILFDLIIKFDLVALPILFLISLLYLNLNFSFLVGLLYIPISLFIFFLYEWIDSGSQLVLSLFNKYQLFDINNLAIFIFGTASISIFTYVRNILYKKAVEFEKQRIAITEITNTNIKLQDYANKIKEISESEERSRLRRDIHDILAHSLTSMVVQIGACEKMVHDDPDGVVEELTIVRETIRESLMEVRATLRELRLPIKNITNGRISWEKLVSTFAKVTGISINFDIDDNFDILDKDLNEIIYRILQEGLTNAYRHGHAKKVDIVIKWDEDYLYIRISDNGDGVNIMKEGLGYLGMRERLREINGKLAWRSIEGLGFDLGIDIPVKGGGYIG